MASPLSDRMAELESLLEQVSSEVLAQAQTLANLVETVDSCLGVIRPVVESWECTCGRLFPRRHGLDVHVGRQSHGVHGWVGDVPSPAELAAQRDRMHAQARSGAAAHAFDVGRVDPLGRFGRVQERGAE